MQHTIKIILFLLPAFAFSRQLPIEALKKNGISQEEIDSTLAMKGENGVNRYFLICRLKNTSTNPSHRILFKHYALFTPDHQLLPLAKDDRYQSDVVFFDFTNDAVVLLEKYDIMKKTLRISKFNVQTGQLVRQYAGDVPCKYGNDCEWFVLKQRKVAFYTNVFPENGLDRATIYEYNWKTDALKRIGTEGLALDSSTGINFNLSDVKFNRKSKSFEYGQ